MKRATQKKIVQFAGFLSLRLAMVLVLAILALFLYDIVKKGEGSSAGSSSRRPPAGA